MLADNFNTTQSNCNLGYNFSLPEGLEKGTPEGKSYLAGGPNFLVKEFEVYQLDFI